MSYPKAKTNIRYGASGALAFALRQVDRMVPPAARSRAFANVSAFAVERPFLFSFALLQALFSFIPLLVFATFAASTIACAVAAALLFILFWVGLALLLLLPVVLVTATVAVTCWVWAVPAFFIVRWLYPRAIPSASGRGAGLPPSNGHPTMVVKDENGVRVDATH